MTITTMRSIDRYAGIPLCWIAGIALRFRRLFRRRPKRLQPQEILFMKFFGLGSVILSMPAVAAMRRRYPAARITYLTFRANSEILRRYACIDTVLAIDPAGVRTFARTTWQILASFRKARYDTVIDFEFFSKFSTLLSALTAAERRSGFMLPAVWRRLHLTHPAPLSKSEHVTAAFGRLVAAFCGHAPDEAPVPPGITPDDAASLRRKISLNGISPVVFHVSAGATFPERRWPAERFADLIRTAANGAPICLTGTADERSYVESIIAASGCADRCSNLAGSLTLPELAALLREADLVVSNDSGPLHLAAALGVRVIGLYGPESPTFYGPVGENATVVYRPTPCSPCMNVYAAKAYRCPYEARCMRQIEVVDVARLMATESVA